MIMISKEYKRKIAEEEEKENTIGYRCSAENGKKEGKNWSPKKFKSGKGNLNYLKIVGFMNFLFCYMIVNILGFCYIYVNYP